MEATKFLHQHGRLPWPRHRLGVVGMLGVLRTWKPPGPATTWSPTMASPPPGDVGDMEAVRGVGDMGSLEDIGRHWRCWGRWGHHGEH